VKPTAAGAEIARGAVSLALMRGSAAAQCDAETVAWVRSLRADGREREDAVRQLHELLLGVARRELRRRSLAGDISGPELDDLAHQAAADALVAITAKLDQFRGESRFTTWAYGFVILEVSAKLARHFWRSPFASATEEDWSRLPDRFALDPHRRAEWRDLVDGLRRGVDECLTDHQRRLFVAIVLNSVPLDAMVVELDSSRNAIYKSLYDARRKLRRWLVAQGYLDSEAAR
jgi:RNA polymerase sigma-70 factor (ECF subfamily)